MNFKDKLKNNLTVSPSGSKEDIKISYQIKIVKVTGLSKSSYAPLLISWKRGSKKENTGELKTIPREGEAIVDHNLNINATITKTPKGFLEKTILFTVKEEKIGKKPNLLGTISVNLAQYAESKTEKTHPFPIQDKTKVVCNLYLSIQSSWLRVNGKSLVKAEGNQKEILQELGKQKFSHEGNDYFLQTEQDMSEPDQTDFGDHDSDNEEEHVDFDDDSNDKSNVSTLSRKSSSSSIDKESLHSGSGTPSKDTHSDSTTSTTTTTPLPLIKESSEKDLTLAAANLKLKKYKKQIKQLTADLEKTKTACNGLTKDRDEKVEEIKKMLDDMETIKDRSKSVGNGVIADYTKQIDTLNDKLAAINKDNENLKIQLQRERNQSSQDSNQVTVLQNQLITVNSQLNTIRNENTQLNGTVRNLEAQLRESSSNKPEELQNALATVQNLHLELNQLRGQIAQTTEENRSQFIQLEQERLKSNSSESNINRIEQEKANLQQRLEHYERTIHLQLEDFEKEKLKISAEVGELKQKLTNYEQLEKELEELKEKLAVAEKSNESSAASASEEQEQKQRELQDEVVQLKDKLTAKESLFKETEDQLEEKSIQLDEKTGQLDEKNNEIKSLQDKLKQFEESSNSSENQEVTLKLQEKEQEISNLTQEIKVFEAQILERQQQYTNEIEQLKSTIESLESKLNEAQLNSQDGNQEFESKIKQLQVELEEKDQIIKDREADILAAKEVSSLYENEKNQMAKEFESVQNQVQQLQSSSEEYEQLKEKFDKLKNKKDTYKVLCTNQKVQIEQLEEKQKSSIQESSNLGEQQQEIEELTNQLETLKSKLIHETNENNSIQDENSQLKSQVVSYQLESDSKQKIIIEYQDLISQLEKDLESSKEEKEKLHSELTEAQEQLSNKKGSDDESSDSDNDEVEEFKEKIQYQKEKIKALKEDLEQKQDEWIDIKIKMEETIQSKHDEIERLTSQQGSSGNEAAEVEKLVNENNQLKQEIERLKERQESMVPITVPVPTTKDDSHLFEEIENHKKNIERYENLYEKEQDKVKSLKEQLEELNLKNDEISQELQDLRVNVEQQRLSVPGSPMSARSMNSTATGVAEVEDIKKEMEENKNIEQSIYWSELDFDRNNVPHCGNNVWQMVDSIGGLANAKNQRMLTKIVTALEKSFLRSGNDCKFISYWFSTVSYILYKINQAGYTQESSNPLKSGVEISVNNFVTPAPEIGGSFIRDLQSLNLSIYSKLLSVTEIKLEKVLISSVFLPDSIILEAQKSPISKNSSSPNSTKNSSSGNSINNLLSILDGVITFLKEGRIFDSISSQFLNQVFYFMNAQITNYLLSNSKVCTTTQGLEVKMGVSRLKEWCSQTPYKSASQQLDSSHEASNLLVIDKNVFVDIDAIKSIFQKLNLHQIKQLLESFTPDNLSPDPLPMVLKKALESNWRQTFDINSLPLLIDSTKKFK
ncbi:hypothetical protein DICPUDRAFT_156561 [Dictyostelium purpureum]|uniref:C2 NT-type domain-containing protein n=1 Tax=Dictyostelium purpureum TaxID=5786 RepID=F0ZWW5_DICPU|nr:uncharacterized protein DICPUDRAFT_156561 [Dictyostelium purpureum]EGC31569.1 hypothetical protein DICPUDRAFT_156561 [Dictyostelium purpureum]|eukprot:XP_003291911.1 hypothetical protein DICPUDRAFT_156561 [Dictyostelium purpureum]